jgi:hypothetical protein
VALEGQLGLGGPLRFDVSGASQDPHLEPPPKQVHVAHFGILPLPPETLVLEPRLPYQAVAPWARSRRKPSPRILIFRCRATPEIVGHCFEFMVAQSFSSPCVGIGKVHLKYGRNLWGWLTAARGQMSP